MALFRTENDFVQWLKRLASRKHQAKAGQRSRTKKQLRLGIGDDAALVTVSAGHELILTTDMSIEDVHFTRRLHPPEAVGHRALARSLSDIAAMGGTPCYALVSLALSKETTRDWVSRFYRGMLSLARRFGVELIGGDTAMASVKTFIDVLVAGEVPSGESLQRSGAQPGDRIFVSGRLGLSALGLRILQHQPKGRPSKAVAREALRTHLYPEPQCVLGRFLSEHRLASAMMDLSDGLSTDLYRLCKASGVGARLWEDKIPSPELSDAKSSLQMALHGGEDYQLLFTAPGTARLSQFHGQQLHQIGEVVPAKGMKLVGTDGKVRILQPAGWDHFR